MVELDSLVTFEADTGRTVTMINAASRLKQFGIDDGWAFYDDLYIRPYVDMTLDISESYDVTATVQHVTGDPVMTFNLTSREPNGTADIKLTGLKPGGWYRLRFNNRLARTANGRAHGQATDDGVVEFPEVNVPNE